MDKVLKFDAELSLIDILYIDYNNLQKILREEGSDDGDNNDK